jgi:calcineurin-like phosphoesterase family protein
MDRAMMVNWNAVVRDNDTVYHLGDIAFSKPQRAKQILSQLNGNIVVVPGNHDSHKQLHALLELSVEKVFVASQYLEINYESRKFVLCHFPIESWNNMRHGAIHLHGHSHGAGRKAPFRIDVGVDCHNFYPVSIERIIGMAVAYPAPERPDKHGGVVSVQRVDSTIPSPSESAVVLERYATIS